MRTSLLKDVGEVVPSPVCLKCDVCCRYPEETTVYVPYFLREETASLAGDLPSIGRSRDNKPLPVSCSDGYACRFFDPACNGCRIYDARPFDCRIYPFMVTYDRDLKSIVLVLDTKCPYLADKADSVEVRSYIDRLVDVLESPDMVEKLNSDKNFFNDFQEDSIVLRRLEKLSERICFSSLGLAKISLKDKGLFDGQFSGMDTMLSAFSFVSVYIWSGVLNILHAEMDGALLVFAGNDGDYFLFLPPVGAGAREKAVGAAFEMLSHMNRKDFAPKIENVPEDYDKNAEFLRLERSCQEYVYDRGEIVGMKGVRFKDKRNLVNYFMENCRARLAFRELEERYVAGSLELYREWAEAKLGRDGDNYSRIMIEDSYFAQKLALLNLRSLGLQGRVVVTEEGVVKGCTVGFPLNKEVFVVLFETTDPGIKGLPQYMFREFLRGVPDHKYVNVLGDYGLKNLKKTKDSYHPVMKPSVFTAFRGKNVL